MALNILSSPQAAPRQLDRYLIVNEVFARMKFVLSIGLMSSSAAASPILFEYRKTWLVDILIFFISAALFMVLYHEQIQKYGPWMLAITTLLGFLAYSSARTSLEELIPWIAVAICLSLLLTAYFLPKLSEISSGPDDAQLRGEDGRSYNLQDLIVEPGSVQSSEDIQYQGHSLFVPRFREQEVSHMDGSGMNFPGTSSARSSDIDLEDQRESVVGMFNGPRRNSSSLGYPLSKVAAVPVENFYRGPDEFPRTQSPDSLAMRYHPSVSAESESPLLNG